MGTYAIMRILAIQVILTFFILICYYDTLHGDFVFDDTVAIVKNDDVSRRSINISNIFKHDFWGNNITGATSHKSYRPLTILMFRWEYGYFNSSSATMKTINLILHCINTYFILLFFLLITNHVSISIIGAGIFAVHPIHTEAVCGIVGRAELLFSICYIFSLLLYLSIDNKKILSASIISRYILLIILSIVGLLCKENAITILPVCICYDLIMRTNLLRRGVNRLFVKKIVLLRSGILTLLTILLLLSRLYIQGFESPKFKLMDNPFAAIDNPIFKFLSQSYLYVLNIWILLCPHWLSFDWAMGCVQTITSLLDLRCLTIAAFYWILYSLLIKRTRLIVLSTALLVVPFLPASGLARLGFVIAERVLYVPSIGFSLLIAIGFVTLLDQFPRFKQVWYILLSILVIVYIARTRQRAKEWTTEERLFTSALKVCPNNAKVHYNIARILTDQGRKKEAFKHYHEAVRLYPQYESALTNLGNLYKDIGEFEAAEKYLKASIEALEEFPSAWMNLGIVQASQKKYEQAMKSYNKALSYKKKYPNCLYNIGNMYLDMKNYSMAMKYWQESVVLNPKQPKAWANILALLDNQGLYNDVLRISERALSYVPNNTAIMFIRANVQGKLNNYIGAEQLYLQVINASPDNALYHNNLGVLYHRWGKKDLAIKSYQRAISIDSNLKSAQENLQKLLKIVKN